MISDSYVSEGRDRENRSPSPTLSQGGHNTSPNANEEERAPRERDRDRHHPMGGYQTNSTQRARKYNSHHTSGSNHSNSNNNLNYTHNSSQFNSTVLDARRNTLGPPKQGFMQSIKNTFTNKLSRNKSFSKLSPKSEAMVDKALKSLDTPHSDQTAYYAQQSHSHHNSHDKDDGGNEMGDSDRCRENFQNPVNCAASPAPFLTPKIPTLKPKKEVKINRVRSATRPNVEGSRSNYIKPSRNREVKGKILTLFVRNSGGYHALFINFSSVSLNFLFSQSFKRPK